MWKSNFACRRAWPEPVHSPPLPLSSAVPEPSQSLVVVASDSRPFHETVSFHVSTRSYHGVFVVKSPVGAIPVADVKLPRARVGAGGNDRCT